MTMSSWKKLAGKLEIGERRSLLVDTRRPEDKAMLMANRVAGVGEEERREALDEVATRLNHPTRENF